MPCSNKACVGGANNGRREATVLRHGRFYCDLHVPPAHWCGYCEASHLWCPRCKQEHGGCPEGRLVQLLERVCLRCLHETADAGRGEGPRRKVLALDRIDFPFCSAPGCGLRGTLRRETQHETEAVSWWCEAHAPDDAEPGRWWTFVLLECGHRVKLLASRVPFSACCPKCVRGAAIDAF